METCNRMARRRRIRGENVSKFNKNPLLFMEVKRTEDKEWCIHCYSCKAEIPLKVQYMSEAWKQWLIHVNHNHAHQLIVYRRVFARIKKAWK